MRRRRNLNGRTLLDAGYTYAWAQVRKQIMARDRWQCQMCGRPAEEIDHRVPRHQGGGDDLPNLWAVCRPCHRAKTARELPGLRRRAEKARLARAPVGPAVAIRPIRGWFELP